MAGLQEDCKHILHGTTLPIEQPWGHHAPFAFPQQTNRNLTHSHEEYLLWIILLPFPCAPPEQVGPGARLLQAVCQQPSEVAVAVTGDLM